MLANLKSTMKQPVSIFQHLFHGKFGRLVPLITVICFWHFEVGMVFPTRTLVAQQIGVSTPFTTTRDSYYERLGVNFGFSLSFQRYHQLLI